MGECCGVGTGKWTLTHRIDFSGCRVCFATYREDCLERRNVMSEEKGSCGDDGRKEEKIRYDVPEEGLAGEEKTRDCVRETNAEYGALQGGYTLEDYYALPDDQRVELIDGVFYDMAAPTVGHQIIGLEIREQLSAYIKAQKGRYLPLAAPVDVQLDCDNRTMVQPDVLLVCDRSKVIGRCIYGAPDFIVEVLSRSTARKDMGIKLEKYERAGVREYWMVDLKQKRVLVYDFANGRSVAIFGLESRIPVGVLDGMCIIDFAPICELLQDWTSDE